MSVMPLTQPSIDIFIYYVQNNDSNKNQYSSREEVVSSLVEKCFGAAKAGTKQKATDIVLLYAEIDQPDGVIVNDDN